MSWPEVVNNLVTLIFWAFVIGVFWTGRWPWK
jgi:hypothetical protein